METANKIIELEDRISRIVYEDNKRTVHFDYKTLEYEVTIDRIESGQPQFRPVNKKQVFAYTYNPDNGETFILKISTSDTFESALKDILRYVENHKKSMNSFTVLWGKKGGTTKIEKSYFYCEDAMEAMTKFFTGKDKSEYIIYEVKLNPIA